MKHPTSTYIRIVVLSTLVVGWSKANLDPITLSTSNKWAYLGTLLAREGRNARFVETDYYVSSIAAPWNIASQECKSILNATAELLSLESQEESDAINFYLQDSGVSPGHYWTSGLYDLGQEVWRWAGNPGADFDNFTNWGVNEPSATRPISRISLHFFNQLYSRWEVRDDTLLTRYICEVPRSVIDPTTVAPTTTMAPTTETFSPTTVPTSTIAPTTETIAPTSTILPTTTTNPTNPIPCPTSTSLIIVLDSSLAMTARNFETAKEFSANLASSFTSHTTSKVGFITFSLTSKIVVPLSSPSTPEIINGKILAAEFIGMIHRMTHDGMTYAKLQLETYGQLVRVCVRN